MNVSVALAAPVTPPLTGASIMDMPLASAAADTARAVIGSIVEQSTRMVLPLAFSMIVADTSLTCSIASGTCPPLAVLCSNLFRTTKHCEDDIGGACDGSNILPRRGALFDKLIDGGAVHVVDGERLAAANQVASHWCTHVTEANEPDRRRQTSTR